MELWSYWWLIFPVGAAIGGFARRWSATSERRRRIAHKQQLELIAAQRDAGVIPPPASVTAPPTASPQAARAALSQVFTEHDQITHRWLEYELDVAKVIDYPAMSDGRRPLTAAFLRAKRVADSLRPAPDAEVTPEQVKAYRDAVTDFGVAFDVAEQDARRLRDSDFTPDEQKRLDRAQKLLRTATDTAATSAERQTAYKRVRQELDGLIVLSDDAVTLLEKKVAQELPPAKAD